AECAQSGGTMKVKQIATSGLRAFLVLTLLSFLPMVSVRVFAQSQGQPQSQPAGEAQKSGEAQKGDHPGVGQELAKESRKAAGEEEEENANLKYSAMVRKLA